MEQRLCMSRLRVRRDHSRLPESAGCVKPSHVRNRVPSAKLESGPPARVDSQYAGLTSIVRRLGIPSFVRVCPSPVFPPGRLTLIN